MASFKMIEVTGATKSEALAQVSDLFTVTYDEKGNVNSISDATQKYNKWKETQTSGITEAGKKAFGVEYLDTKKAIPGKAYYITIEAAVKSQRENPYKVENVKNEVGKREFDKAYNLIDEATGKVLDTINTVMGKINKPLKDENGNNITKTVTKVKKIKDEDGNITEQTVEVEVNETEKVDGKIRPTKTIANERAKELIRKGHRGTILIEEVHATKNPIVSKVIYTPSKSAKFGTYLVFGYVKD